MTRRTDIDMAKGLAILLVVFGHLVARTDPAGVGWYEPLRRAVYGFHMPLFFYLAGLVYALRPGFLGKRAVRLLVPFFGLGVLEVLCKLVAARVMFVDNAPAGLAPGLADLVWHTAASPALSIWFLFVLFVYCALAAGLFRGRGLVFLGLGAALYLVPLPADFYLDRIGRFAVFFAFGLCAGAAGERWLGLVDWVWPWCLAGLFVILIPYAIFGTGWQEDVRILLLAGGFSAPAIHGLLRYSRLKKLNEAFLFLGRYCFMIYLFNTLFIGLAKALLLPVWGWNAAHFLPFAAALMAAGVIGPICLKRYGLRYIAPLDRLTD
jgi:fucose 4-O-acetylase-like acetyltransferase